MAKPKVGSIVWHDLTVNDATSVRDFYGAVVGWEPSAVDMGDYEDFSMRPKGEKEGVAGICNSRGPNADLPKSWLCYVVVASLDDSLATVNALGGEVLVQARPLGAGRFAVIKDPQGGVIGLYQA
jgi:uncharacterized protein